MKRFVFAALLASASAVAQADVIWDNGLGADHATSGYFSSSSQHWRTYDNFGLSDSATVDHVFFQMGLTSGAFAGSFTFSVYDEAGGNAVGSQLYTATLGSGDYSASPAAIDSFPNGPFYNVEFDIAPLDLGPGRYWLSFYGLDMDFRSPNVGNNHYFLQQHFAEAAEIRAGDTPFRLDGTVHIPEPSSCALAALSLALLGAARRRKPAGAGTRKLCRPA